MFDSTLTLARSELLAWASSGTLAGTLALGSDPTFEWQVLALRDRQLAQRDLVLANAIADVGAMISTVWGGQVAYSAPPSPVESMETPGASSLSTSVSGTVAHVMPSSLPEAALATDLALLSRDNVLLAGLKGLASTLVPDVEVPGTVAGTVSPTEAWSLAEGSTEDASVNPIMPLNVDTLKVPDTVSAERDNQLAANIALLDSMLRNPFEFATRLNIRTSDVETESYVLVFENDIIRFWKAEPGLSGRMAITYVKATQEVSWTGPDSDIVPLYDKQPFFVGGTISGDVEIVPGLDERKDVEFWRAKASQVKTTSIVETTAFLVTEPGSYATGDVMEDRGSAILVKPGTAVIRLSDLTLGPGLARVSATFTPTAEIMVDGNKGVGGAPSSTQVYTTYPMAGGSIYWPLKLPLGTWSMKLYYTNLVGTAQPWPFTVQFAGQMVSNLGLKFTKTNGEVDTTSFLVSNTTGYGDLTLTWTPTDSSNQLRIERIVFTRTPEEQVFKLSARLGVLSGTSLGLAYGPETAEFDSYPERPDSFSFLFNVESALATPALELTWVTGEGDTTLLRLGTVDLVTYTWRDVTANAVSMKGWPTEMAERAAKAVLESFIEGLRLEPGFDPTLDIDGHKYWTKDSTQLWLTKLKTQEPRFDQAFISGGPGCVGRPALAPLGLSYDFLNEVAPRATTLDVEVGGETDLARVTIAGTQCYPALVSFKPWMAYLGLPVLAEDFWAEDTAKLKLLSVNLTASPSANGVVHGSGLYPYSTLVQVEATADPDIPGNTFDGWYEGAILLSTSPTWVFLLVKTITLEARFSAP